MNLISLLQKLGDAEHDDLSVAHDAIAEIVRLRLSTQELREERDALLEADVARRSVTIHRLWTERDNLRAQNADLLEALKEIVAAADGKGWEQLDPSFKKARAAIAKAEGEKR